MRAVRVTYDPSVDAAYIYLREIGAGDAAYQVPVEAEEAAGEIILDLDRDGRLIGIEVLGATATLPPAVLEQAERL